MNLQKVKEIIEFYKKHFYAISKEEIYKWQAVKHFQDNWNIDAENFAEMLEDSLSRAKNLLVSVNYFPRQMLKLNARKEPETVRNLFYELYNEDRDWLKRIVDFQKGVASINEKYFPGKGHYQDGRAVLVYLTFRFPDIYFFYKFTMFKEFVEEVEYPYKPKRRAVENLTVYSNLCELLKEEIIKDAELLELHSQRLTENHYSDKSSNILTQDVIYATVRHFERFENQTAQEPVLNRLIKVNKRVIPKPDKIILKGSFVNHIENEKAKKRIGDLGELLVLKYEQAKMKTLSSKKQPEHIAKTKGDGEGYDILSYDKSGEEIFIEVKTTTGNYDTPFFITRNELEKSINEKEKFYLYRLYNFDEKEDTAEFYLEQGSLENLCVNPMLYRVKVEEDKSASSEQIRG